MHRSRSAAAGPPASACLRSLQVRPRSALWLMLALVLSGVLLEGVAAPWASAQGQVAALQCRLAGGPWQPCRMEIEEIGQHWVLRIGQQRIEFRHSGDGAVRMQTGASSWQTVTATWQKDTSLCWDGVCAKGDIPLD
jgi:hypothetical protein